MTRIKTALFLTLAFSFTAAAQNRDYAMPKKVATDRLVRRTFPEYRGGSHFPHLIAEQFFPIGWSKDGKLAYYVEPVDEACGCYFAHLVIKDMRTDKVLWEFKYSQDDTFDDKGNMTGPGNIRDLWQKNRKQFSEKLRAHGIVASSFAMLPRKFTSGGRTFTASLKTVKANDPDGNPRVKTHTVSLSTPKLGSKVLHTAASGTGDDLWVAPLDADVIGVLKSPYENRIAVVAIKVNRGWEGPPHTADIHIVGAELTSGFKAK